MVTVRLATFLQTLSKYSHLAILLVYMPSILGLPYLNDGTSIQQLYGDGVLNGDTDISDRLFPSYNDQRNTIDAYGHTLDNDMDWSSDSNEIENEIISQLVGSYRNENDYKRSVNRDVLNKLVGARAKRFGYSYHPYLISPRPMTRARNWNGPSKLWMTSRDNDFAKVKRRLAFTALRGR
ncbi:uncharacterized protein LOC128236222 [Mya arenaria]|uniref:uncharacterized protein LOC128236222 n=1 Tax=Mya arenaria TaxID=6604 RepID=UPI0022E0F681|nr:uncharacterized protein LOC128236222 [Mya arenaria]